LRLNRITILKSTFVKPPAYPENKLFMLIAHYLYPWAFEEKIQGQNVLGPFLAKP